MDARRLAKLQKLRLNGNQISKIENLSANTALVSLDLSFNQIGKIEGMVSQALLQELDLSHNQLAVAENLPGRYVAALWLRLSAATAGFPLINLA
eukprot:SAG31_NODE_26631_length_439_cov_0.755882_1_plen_94_part_01